MIRILDYQPIEVLIMKENMYSTTEVLYTASFSLMLVFLMLAVITVGTLLKYHRLNTQFQKDAIGFRTSFLKNSFGTHDNTVTWDDNTRANYSVARTGTFNKNELLCAESNIRNSSTLLLETPKLSELRINRITGNTNINETITSNSSGEIIDSKT